MVVKFGSERISLQIDVGLKLMDGLRPKVGSKMSGLRSKVGSGRIAGSRAMVGLKLMDSSRATADSKLVVQQAEVYQGVMDAYAYGLIETDV